MRVLALLAMGLLVGCASNQYLRKLPTSVTGHVTYRERVALPADAEVRVQILDVSGQDTAAASVADTTIRPAGRQVPLPFVLRFDPKRIDPRREYSIRATINIEGRPAFTTTAVVKVLTRDHPTAVDLVLSHMQAADSSATPAPAAALMGAWVLEDIGGRGVVDDARATLELGEPGRAAGRGSCNRFSGPVTIQGPAISFGPLVSTKMACAEAVMDQETRYLSALEEADRYRLDGPWLLIYGKGSDKPLRFSRADAR